MSPSKKVISIVIPVFNEDQNIQTLAESILMVINPLPYFFELFFIDDGSNDQTVEKIRGLLHKDKRVWLIFLSRNSGH